MRSVSDAEEAGRIASAIRSDIRALRIRKTPNLRAVRRKYTRALQRADAGTVLRLAETLLLSGRNRWIAYELIRNHKAAFQRLNAAELRALGRGIDSWWSVDGFARTLSGPAWVKGLVPDRTFLCWARSKDRWWRRAALVSTVALNSLRDGGSGDAARTLRICSLLAADRDDMVVKAMSWALRALAVRDPQAVRRFLGKHEAVLAARVRREVRNKLETGLKNPMRRRH